MFREVIHEMRGDMTLSPVLTFADALRALTVHLVFPIGPEHSFGGD